MKLRINKIPFLFKNRKSKNIRINNAITEELLRQIKFRFNLSMLIAASSASVTLFGVCLVFINKVPSASIPTVASTLIALINATYARELKQELFELIEQYEE